MESLVALRKEAFAADAGYRFQRFVGLPKGNAHSRGSPARPRMNPRASLHGARFYVFGKFVRPPFLPRDGTEAGEFTSPLKLFEYMAAVKFIVATGVPSVLEILRPGENSVITPLDEEEFI